MARSVEAVAAAVAGAGRIAVLPRADAASLAVVLGAMRAGVSVVLLHRHLTAPQLAHAVAVARPGLIVADGGRLPAALASEAPPVMRPERLAGEGEAAAGPSSGSAAPPQLASARPGDELLVGLTSGTSGEPKLFVRDQASWAATLERSDAAFDVRPGDRVSVPGPLDHTHFLYGALHALTRGATVDLRPLGEAFAPEAGPVTHVYLVPTLAGDLAELLAGRPQRARREVASSSADWPPQARARLAALLPNAEILHFYGASELSFVALDRWPAINGALPSHGDAKAPVIEAGAVGEPFQGVEVEVRDGIVHVRSAMLFSGYLGEDGRLSGGPDGEGWFTVGDRGTLSADGRLTLAGRASDTIVYGGLKVEPAEVEQALADLPGVAEIACAGLPEERWGAVPVVALVLAHAPSSPLTRAALREHARATLPQPSRPHRFFVVDRLPRTPRGKLDRVALVARLLAGDARELP